MNIVAGSCIMALAVLILAQSILELKPRARAPKKPTRASVAPVRRKSSTDWDAIMEHTKIKTARDVSGRTRTAKKKESGGIIS